MSRTAPWLLALSLAFPAGRAWAEEPTTVQDLVVTATRLPTPQSLEPDAEVVTDQQIELRQATFAFDALADIPGVQVSRQGAFGGVTSVMIRGAPADKTLVLIDGAPALRLPCRYRDHPANGVRAPERPLRSFEHLDARETPSRSTPEKSNAP